MSGTTASASAPASPVSSRPLDDWLNVVEAARWIKVGHLVIRKAISRGELRAASVNARGDLRIHRSWLIKWMQTRAERAPQG